MIADATGIVLAGGRSARFGRDKALAPWRGGTLVEAVCASLLEVLPEAIVVAKPGQHRPTGDERLSLIFDARRLRHPLSGLESGLRACRTSWAFAVACDMPFVDSALILRLAASRAGAQAVAARGAGRAQPLAAFYAREILPMLSAHLDSGGSATSLLDRLDTAWVDGGSARAFFDLDDRASYREAVKRR